ncbi:MAG TPA: RNA polymerase subunit sigma-24 [candidate division Zixibacteria bacterium]|nr:RNA polymerase subunit sigma-24 [candidate division Zixibacteria bacterium]
MYRQAIFHITVKIVRNPDEANDLVQETFIKAFGSLKTYDHNYRFSTWLYKIAANSSIDFLRKRKLDSLSLDKPIATKDGDVQMEIPDNTYNPEHDLRNQERSNGIEEAIESLPEKYKEVIVLRHKEDRSYEEIAALLKVPVGTVKARIFRARELLKKKLKSIR